MSNLVTIIHPVGSATPRVVEFNQALVDLSERMRLICLEESLSSLAATQLGISTNMILVRGDLYVNPRIIQGEESFGSHESCIKDGPQTLSFIRFASLHLYYQTLSGEEKMTWITDKDLAVEIQHQIGHVQGDTQYAGSKTAPDPGQLPAPYSPLIANPSRCMTCGPSKWHPRKEK